MTYPKFLLGCMLVLFSMSLSAADISNPRAHVFVADKTENLIDVISIRNGQVVHRIETSIHPDHIVVTPFSSVLVYTDIKQKKLVFYDLEEQKERKIVELEVTPRNVVLDTTGSKIGITDDQDGGFALVYAMDFKLAFSLKDFPASPDVLFDPNDISVYYTNLETGALGLLNTISKEYADIPITSEPGQQLTAPTRSMDGRYIYVGNLSTAEVYAMNSFSGEVFQTFDVGGEVARPYTTPDGSFLYVMDAQEGRVKAISQQGFCEYTSADFEQGIDLVTVGRFDRLNLFMGSDHKKWYLYDNLTKTISSQGEFRGTPLNAFGSPDGKLAYVAFQDHDELAIIGLENSLVQYFSATENGAGAFAVGLSNNVCH